MPEPTRQQLIVIHGWGGSYLEAAERLTGLLQTESYWHHGTILVPARKATLLRHLLLEPSEDPYTQCLRTLLVSRFLLSPPLPKDQSPHDAAFSRFSEDRIRRDFPALGIPYAPAARRIRGQQLCREAETQMEPLLQVLRHLQTRMRQSKAAHTEKAVRTLLDELSLAGGLSGSIVPLLESLRDMHETGGDLDTVASAVLYATWLQQRARTQGRPFRYGHEFRFVFVNYHESLRSLAAYAPADLYLADLPIAAFPALASDIRYLARQGVHTARYEDHHPYNPERKNELQNLQQDGLLDFFSLSGPATDMELDPADLQCAADMVHESCVSSLPAPQQPPGTHSLREAAHGEDFVTGRTRLGILLTDLIKGGICKVELAQILLDAMPEDDVWDRLTARGWASLPEQWRANLDQTAQTLKENVAMLELAPPAAARILCVKAVHAEPGSPKYPTGKAIEFLARTYPDAQYAFYCFGSALMVARRLDQDNTSLNLGSLMPVIGTDGDGGHAGAAVCRPDANPAFPTRLLAHISDANFITYARYLGDRLSQAGYPVEGLQNVSQTSNARWSSANRKLCIVVGAAFCLGLLLLTFVPQFRPAAVQHSNLHFFPQIEGQEHATHETEEPEP